MTGGARKAPTDPAGNLIRVGGGVLTALLVVTIVVLLVFGDRLVADDPAENDRDKEVAEVAPEVTEAQRDEVVEAASTVLDTWSQPELGYDAWWAALKPLLTPGGREAYSYTDPAQVPALGDLAADHVVLNPSGATATVWFETSDGRFGVDLSRKGATGAWLANRVVFPGEESMFA